MPKATPPAAGDRLMSLFINHLIDLMEDPEVEKKAADLEVVRKFLGDQSITLASVQRGDFGTFAQEAAKEFMPFPGEDETSPPLQ